MSTAAAVALAGMIVTDGSVSAGGLRSVVTGVVSDQAGDPLPGIDVTVRTSTSTLFEMTTVEDGLYSTEVSVPSAGQGIFIDFVDPSGAYAADFGSEVFMQPGYDEVWSVALQPGGQIIGAVALDGSPLEGMCVRVQGPGTSQLEPVRFCTDVAGSFETFGLLPGDYRVSYPTFGFSADPVPPVHVTVDTGPNHIGTQQLTTLGASELTVNVVSYADGTTPVSGCLEVELYSPASLADSIGWSGCATDGQFTTVGLPDAQYWANFFPDDGVHNRIGQLVTLDGPTIVTLQPRVGGSISGEITSTGTFSQPPSVTLCSPATGQCVDGEVAPVGDGSTAYTWSAAALSNIYDITFSAPFHDAETFANIGFSPFGVPGPIVISDFDVELQANDVGSVSGSVVEWGSNAPLEAAVVHAIRDGDLTRAASVPVDSNGNFVFTALAAGSYRFEAVAIGYQTQRYGSPGGSAVEVETASAVGGIDFVLEAQGVIEGTATASSSGGTLDVYCATITSADESFPDRVACARVGQPFRATKLPTGTYDVSFSSQRYFDAQYPTTVSVTAPGVTSGISVVLDPRPTISGTVTDPGEEPVNEGVVVIYDSEFEPVQIRYLGVSNSYQVPLDPGTYYVAVYPSIWFKNQFHADAPDLMSATPVVITTGSSQVVDFQLDEAVQIRGTVTAGGGAPLSNVAVRAWSGEFTIEEWTYTDFSGDYRMALPPGTYEVQFGGEPVTGTDAFSPRWWDDAVERSAATEIVLGDGVDVATVDQVLPARRSLGVTLTSEYGWPSSCVIRLFDAVTQVLERSIAACSPTQIVWADPGLYKLRIDPPFFSNAFVPTWYGGDSFESATLIDLLGSNRTVTVAFNFGNVIAGTITADGEPADGCVDLFDEWQWAVASSCVDDGSGTYALTGVQPGEYRLRFVDYSGEYAPQWWNGTSFDDAEVIEVVDGEQTTTTANFEVTEAGFIAGTLQTDEGDPVDACVIAFTVPEYSYVSGTCTIGSYSIGGLATGTYRLAYVPEEPGYASGWWQNASSFDDADDISVVGGETAEVNIVFAEEQVGSIAGTISTVSQPFAWFDFCITLYVAGTNDFVTQHCDWVFAGSGSHDYVISSVPAGEYDILFNEQNTGTSRWYDNVSSQEDATPVEVMSDEVTSGIDFLVTTPGSISGSLSPSGDYCIQVFEVDGYSVAGTCEYDADSYTVGNLPPGDYEVLVYSDDGPPLWFPGVLDRENAIVVTVASGQNTGGINFTFPEPGSVEGTVIIDGQPGEGCVTLFRASTLESVDNTCDLSGGSFAFSNVFPGEYRLFFNDWSGLDLTRWYPSHASGSDSVIITVDEGETTTADFVFGTSGSITVTIDDLVAGADSGCVNVYATLGSSAQSVCFGGTWTVTVDGLLTGQYSVRFIPDAPNLAAVWYENATSFATATPVPVVFGSDVGIEVSPGVGSSISGTVNVSGDPAEVCVEAFISGDPVSYWVCGPDGEYTIVNLPADEFVVRARDAWSDTHLTQWYDGVSSESEATPVQIPSVGDNVPNIDFTLIEGATITGQISSADGDVYLCVLLYAVEGDFDPDDQLPSRVECLWSSDSPYWFDLLPPGDYVVWASGDEIEDQWFGGGSSFENATLIDLGAGEEFVADFTVVASEGGGGGHGAIAGYLSSDGSSVHVCVEVYDLDAVLVVEDCFDDDQYFMVVPAGEYRVRFDDDGYVVWYDDAWGFPFADSVFVQAGMTTFGVNYATPSAPALGSITVEVYDSDSSMRLNEDVCIELYSGLEFLETRCLFGDDEAEFSGLTAGSYTLEAFRSDPGWVTSRQTIFLDPGGVEYVELDVQFDPWLAITDLQAAPADGQIDLTWSVASAAGPQFIVQTSTDGGATWDAQTVVNEESYSATDLTNGDNYTFRVRARLGNFWHGPWSDTIIAVPGGEPPVDPLLVTGLVGVAGVGSVELSWDEPAAVGEVVEYRVQYSLDGVVWVSGGGTDGLARSVSGLVGGSEYLFRVRARSSVSGWGPWSELVSVTALLDPLLVTGLVAVPGVGSVELSWDEPVGAVEYHIQRSLDGGETWLGSGRRVEPLRVVRGLEPGDEVWFRVRALDGDRWGPWSEVVTAVPFGEFM